MGASIVTAGQTVPCAALHRKAQVKGPYRQKGRPQIGMLLPLQPLMIDPIDRPRPHQNVHDPLYVFIVLHGGFPDRSLVSHADNTVCPARN
jgi:hypothetical protein